MKKYYLIIVLLITNSIYSNDCYPIGNVNEDNDVDILDIILTVNCILGSECSECSDINYDLDMNILDVVNMVNLILEPPFCLSPNVASIPDGNPLTAYGNPIMAGDPFVLYDEEAEMYKMWHTAYRNQILGIGYGVSEDGLDWDLEADGSWPHVMQPTPGSWDRDGLETVSVMKKDDQYLMWYLGFPCYLDEELTGRMRCIGFAESDDGVNWTKHPEPVLIPTEEWEMPEIYPFWENGIYYEVWYGGVQEPSVHWDDTENIYKMWYEGTTVDTVLDMQNGEFFEHLGKVHQIGYAESLDGITWSKHQDNPIFTPKWGDGSYPWEGWWFVGHTNVIYDPNKGYHLFYFSGHSIGHAFSLDGIHWNRNSSNPILQGNPTNGENFMSFAGPSALFENNQLSMYMMHSIPGAQSWWDNGGMYFGITTGNCE